jgi:hypothetical protein
VKGLVDEECRPGVLCVEYDGRFPPPISVSVAYDENRWWNGDDYYGASLQALADLCKPLGYKLVTCTVLGSNAFFVRENLAAAFDIRPVAELWQPLHLNIAGRRAITRRPLNSFVMRCTDKNWIRPSQAA